MIRVFHKSDQNSYTLAVNDFEGFVNVLDRNDGQDGTENLTETNTRESRQSINGYRTHSSMVESPTGTSLMMVGAMYLLVTSTSPPTTTVPLVLSM